MERLGFNKKELYNHSHFLSSVHMDLYSVLCFYRYDQEDVCRNCT